VSGGRAWLPRVPLGLVPDEFDQVLRLQAFRTERVHQQAPR